MSYILINPSIDPLASQLPFWFQAQQLTYGLGGLHVKGKRHWQLETLFPILALSGIKHVLPIKILGYNYNNPWVRGLVRVVGKRTCFLCALIVLTQVPALGSHSFTDASLCRMKCRMKRNVHRVSIRQMKRRQHQMKHTCCLRQWVLCRGASRCTSRQTGGPAEPVEKEVVYGGKEVKKRGCEEWGGVV
jgi:hypothetical protein